MEKPKVVQKGWVYLYPGYLSERITFLDSNYEEVAKKIWVYAKLENRPVAMKPFLWTIALRLRNNPMVSRKV